MNSILAEQVVIDQWSKDRALIGTAFDYAFRWLTAPMIGHHLVAFSGMVQLAPRWPEVVAIYTQMIENGNKHRADYRQIATYSAILAWFERVARGNSEARQLNYKFKTLEQLITAVEPDVITDLVMLLETVESAWQSDLTQPFIMNPSFIGSHDVGGADADWICASTIYECKCVGGERPFTPSFLYQALGYALLDYSDRYRLSHVGWYFVRHTTRVRMNLDILIPQLFGARDLPDLRNDLRIFMKTHPPPAVEPPTTITVRYIKP